MKTINNPLWSRIAASAMILMLLLMALPAASVQARPLQAIDLRGSPTTATVKNNPNLTINVPAGVVAGDLLIAAIAQDWSQSAITPPAGWTVMDSKNIGWGNHARLVAAFYHQAGASEPADYTFTVGAGAGTEVSGVMLAFSGMNADSPFDVIPGSMTASIGDPVANNTTTASDASLTTNSANAVVLMIGLEAGTAGPGSIPPNWLSWNTATAPGTLTEIVDYKGDQTSIGAAWGIMATQGPTGQGNGVMSSAQRNAGYLLALRPDTAIQTDTNLNSIAPITYGAQVTFTATVTNPVTPPDGELVEFYDGTTLLGTGALSSGVATFTTAEKQMTAEGSPHTITARYVGNATLTASSVWRTLTVNPRPLAVTGITATNKVYDGTTAATLNTNGALLDTSGVLPGDTVTLVTSGAVGTFTPNGNVGNGKTVQVSGLATGGASALNYTITQPTTTANITPLAITVTADAKSKVVGSADPALTFHTVPALAAGDSLSGSLTRVPGDAIGSYPILQGTLTATSNYTMTYVGANLTILAPSGSNLEVRIGGSLTGAYIMGAGSQKRVSFTGINNGPVVIKSTVGAPIIASERVAYFDGSNWTNFSELMGLPSNQLTTSYVLPWYNNVELNSQIRFGNLGTAPTVVTVRVGGVVQGNYYLTPNQSRRVSYIGLNNGPVKITSSGGVPIIASMRVAYTPDGGVTWTSFSELMGLPSNKVSTSYVMPWYNNVELNSQLRFGNVGTASTVVTVTVGGVVQGTYPVGPNQSRRVSYTGLNNGPVVISSSGGVPIIASERVAYTPDGGVTWTSFSELMGLPSNQLTTSYVMPYYNNVELNTQLRFGNVGTANTIVTVKVGGVTQGTYFLAPNQSKRVSYAGLNSGPVKITSSGGVPIIASERVAYTPDGGLTWTSFSELMGLPSNQLFTSYVMPWYNNVEMNTQLRFGVP